MDVSNNIIINFLKNHRNKLIYFLLFIVTTLPFFIYQLVFVFKNTQGVLYGDKINLLADTLDAILFGPLSFKDFFAVHNGQYHPITMMILNYEIDIVGINNASTVSLLFPFLLYVISVIIWLFKLFKTDDIKIKDIAFILLYDLISSLFIYSSYNWQIIWDWQRSIIALSIVCLLMSIGLFQMSVFNYKLNWLFLILSTVIGVLTIFLFGNDTCVYAFLIAIISISTYYFIVKMRKKESNKWLYLGNASIYLIVFVIYIVLIGGKAPASTTTINFGNILQSFIYSHSSIIISMDYDPATIFMRYLAGLTVIIISSFAVFVYFKKKYFYKNIFVFFLFLIGELTIIYVSIFDNKYLISLHYLTYALIALFTIDVLMTLTYEKFEFVMKHSLGIVSTLVASVYAVGMLFPQVYFSLLENEKLSSYREERINQIVYESLMYDERDDAYLESFYNADADKVRSCFDLLKENYLYIYDISQPYFETITDDFKTTNYGYGLYDLGSTNRFTDQEALFFLKCEEECIYDMSMFNPSGFKDNTYTIIVNNEPISDTKTINSGELCKEVIECKRGINKIKIILNHYTCPSEEGTSGDVRHLGVVVNMFRR